MHTEIRRVMSGTAVECSIALGGIALVAAGGTALYCKSNIPHMKDRISQNESDILLLCEEQGAIRRDARAELYLAVESIKEDIESLDNKLNAILDLLQKTGVDVDSFKKKHRKDRRDRKDRKHRKDRDDKEEDPDTIIAMVRGGRK